MSWTHNSLYQFNHLLGQWLPHLLSRPILIQSGPTTRFMVPDNLVNVCHRLRCPSHEYHCVTIFIHFNASSVDKCPALLLFLTHVSFLTYLFSFVFRRRSLKEALNKYRPNLLRQTLRWLICLFNHRPRRTTVREVRKNTSVC